MSLAKQIADKHPELRKKLRIAHIKSTPEKYISGRIKTTIPLAIVLTLVFWMWMDSQGTPYFWFILVPPLVLLGVFQFQLHAVDALIKKRTKEIDKEVLFAGRFLMIKLNTGQPLVNALVDASKSYGVGSKYFREIVQEIELGTPLEDALENAINYSPSEKFQKILFQISNALRIGIDVSKFLESTLEEIANQQLIEIQRYAKKLNSLTLFYMLMGIVIPSLGFTVFMVISSIVDLGIGSELFGIFLGGLLLTQAMFLVLFKQIRPEVAI